MNKSIKSIIAAAALMLCATAAFAQQVDKKDPEVTFNSHWFLQVQGGIGYTEGETKFGDLISPAAAIYAGYQFTPVWGLRFGLSGWEGKGAITTDLVHTYKFDFLQGNVDVTIDLSNWWGGYRWNRFFDAYIFLGVGVNGGFNNKAATKLYDGGFSAQLPYYWSDNHYRNYVYLAGRAGIGANFRVSKRVAINLELNDNMLADHFNSKGGRNPHWNPDWQSNLTLGLTIKLGKTHRTTSKPATAPAPAPVPAPTPAPTPAPAPKPEPAPAPAPKPEPAPAPAPAPVPSTITENIFFLIDSAEIRPAEAVKLDNIVNFLEEHAEAKVVLCGYSDKATGTPSVNLRVSKNRAEAVAEALAAKGIDRSRITVEYKGDTIQPFAVNAQNRVCIVLAE